MQVTGDLDSGLVYKQADSTEERRRLGREASVLHAIAHPGVVQLVRVEGSDPPDRQVVPPHPRGDQAFAVRHSHGKWPLLHAGHPSAVGNNPSHRLGCIRTPPDSLCPSRLRH